MLGTMLGRPKALIGMVHLGPLPGSPRFAGNPVDPERVRRLVAAADRAPGRG